MTASEKGVDAVIHSGEDDGFKAEHAENMKRLPESLIHMSEAEIKVLETKMVRKMDMVIM